MKMFNERYFRTEITKIEMDRNPQDIQEYIAELEAGIERLNRKIISAKNTLLEIESQGE